MKISDNKYVTLTYDLHVGEGEELELMEQATAERPMEFIYGTNSMLEAFEKEIDGLSAGDAFSFSISPEDAYGEYDKNRIIELPKSIFEVDGKIDEEMLFEGNTLPMMDSSGNRLVGSVVSIGENEVTMDFNHPLAGEIMHFSGSIVDVREATVEEIAALFSSGGCGCGCGSGSCGSCGDEAEGGQGGSCGCGSGGGGCGSGCNC